MRSKRFLAVLALVLGALVAFAPVASAQEEDEGETHAENEELFHQVEEILHHDDADHAEIECVELILVEGQTVQDCRDAPNPLLPETNEIIWGAIGFFVVLGFLWWKGLPMAKAAMDERTEKIKADLDAAESAKDEAEAIKAEYAAKVADAKSESARIVDEARQAADQLRADAQLRLNDEIAAQRAQAQADIDTAKGQAMAELRGEVSDIAIGAAERVVGANLDRAAQERLIDDYIASVQSGQA